MSTPPHPETAIGQQPFRLPNGAQTTIVGNGGDVSVFVPASLAGSFEPHLQRLFARIVQPDWVCLDIGANIGLHSLYMASLAEKVVSFEAAPSTFVYLSANRDLFENASRLELVNIALWDEPATVRIAVPTDLEGCAFIAAPSDDAATSLAKLSAANPGTINGNDLSLGFADIAACRLDDWERAHPLDRLDLIKIDVEGSEPRVLAGAARLLSRFEPCLITEYNAKCAQSCFGSAPDYYFSLLQDLFRYIHLVEDEGVRRTPLSGWDELRSELSRGKFWMDLLCTNRPLEMMSGCPLGSAS